MPCHHHLETYHTAYIEGAGLVGNPKGPLFVTIGRGTGLVADAHPSAREERQCDDPPARGGGRHHDPARQS